MKNSFLKFILIPHDEGENKWVKLPLFLIILIVIIFILSGFFFFNNLHRFVNVSSVAFLKTDNQKLEKKVKTLRKKVHNFKGTVDSLLEIQDSTFKTHHILEDIPSDSLHFPPETLLVISQWIDSVFETSLQEEKVLLESIPSIMPVKGRIIKKFGEQIDLYTDKKKPHKGIDILAPLKSPVVSSGKGVVKEVSHNRGKGLFVEISHQSGFISSYCHLLNSTVKKGDRVGRGSLIGYVGQSGRAPYPYLYYEIRKDTVYLDPENFIFRGV